MLPAMCRKPPCMNIEVKRVTHHGFWSIWNGPSSGVRVRPAARDCLGVVLRARADDSGLELPLHLGHRPDGALAGRSRG